MLTVLTNRAAAYLGAGATYPERLGTAIARCRFCAERVEGREGEWGAQIRTRHVRLNASFAMIDGTSAGGAVVRSRGGARLVADRCRCR